MVRSARRFFLLSFASLLAALPAAAQTPWPQDTKNPSLVIEAIPLPSNYMNMGIAFLPDGRMALANAAVETTNGEIPPVSANSNVLLVSGLGAGDMAGISVKKIADMFHQPAGVVYAENRLWISERDGFYLIPAIDNPSNTAANRQKIIGWPVPEAGYAWNNGEQWHQWVMTPMYLDGKFYGPYGGTTQPGGRSAAPATTSYSGAFLSWAPDGAGGLAKVAGGLRQPNGMAVGAGGKLFVTDNQGGWLPACSFQMIKPGKTYGYRQAPPNKPNFAESLPYEPPICWLVDGVHQSASQPMHLDRGPYRGDFVIGDVNSPGLSRVDLDTIADGQYNGGLFFFTGGFGTAAVNRLALNPKEDWFAAGTFLAQGDWPSGNPKPMYRVRFSSAGLPFEMRAIHSRQGGIEIVFSQPVDPATVVAGSFSLQQWHYNRTETYGCCIDQQGNPFAPASVKVSDDRLRVFVASPVVTASQDRELKIVAGGVKSATGGSLFQSTAYFTHNYQSMAAFDPAVAVAPRPAAASVLGATILPGSLRVRLELSGPWTVRLLDPTGRLLAERVGKGPGETRFPTGADHGLRIVQVTGEAGTFARPVAY
jgi:hypothetical protein